MKIKTQITTESGKNGSGKAFFVNLELPFFDDDDIDSFYLKLKERIIRRAERDGSRASSKLCVVYEDGESFSLFIDILFSNKRELTGLYRICDNRKNGLEMPMPKKLKRRGYDSFCVKGDRILAFKNNFDASSGIRVSDYLSAIEQTII